MKVNFKNTNCTTLNSLSIGDFFVYPNELNNLYLLLDSGCEVLNLSTDAINYANYDTKVIKIPQSKITITVEN